MRYLYEATPGPSRGTYHADVNEPINVLCFPRKVPNLGILNKKCIWIFFQQSFMISIHIFNLLKNHFNAMKRMHSARFALVKDLNVNITNNQQFHKSGLRMNREEKLRTASS